MKKEILKLLLDKEGQFISGEEISNDFNVSRTAIWKQIKTLKEAGYVIDSSPRQGYRLVEKPDIILPEEIGIYLDTRIIGRKAYVYDSLDSTNEMAKKMASQGIEEGTVIVAERQLSGKGRMGRLWVSEPGTGIWFSVVFRPEIKPQYAARLTFVIAVAVCKALRRSTGLPIMIKWPNDLLLEKKKICGILTELSAEIDQINYIVAGIGININHDKEEFPPEIRATAGSLFSISGQKYRRAELLVEIMKDLEEQYLMLLDDEFPRILDSWRCMSCTLGDEVYVSSREEQFFGIALDVNEEGHLLVKTEDGQIKQVMAGDVSLRRLILENDK